MICDGVQMKTEHMAHQIVLMPNLLSLYSEDGGVRQTSHLLFEASGSTADQVEWARRFIAGTVAMDRSFAGARRACLPHRRAQLHLVGTRSRQQLRAVQLPTGRPPTPRPASAGSCPRRSYHPSRAASATA